MTLIRSIMFEKREQALTGRVVATMIHADNNALNTKPRNLAVVEWLVACRGSVIADVLSD